VPRSALRGARQNANPKLHDQAKSILIRQGKVPMVNWREQCRLGEDLQIICTEAGLTTLPNIAGKQDLGIEVDDALSISQQVEL
jgi:hypothetical protein